VVYFLETALSFLLRFGEFRDVLVYYLVNEVPQQLRIRRREDAEKT
jgi:hypothetical protein